MDKFLEMKTFAAVVEGGSFVKAADALDMSKRPGAGFDYSHLDKYADEQLLAVQQGHGHFTNIVVDFLDCSPSGKLRSTAANALLLELSSTHTCMESALARYRHERFGAEFSELNIKKMVPGIGFDSFF